ncbi:cobalamin biosynthesis protein [Desulfovibrio sp. OttesenSCG-928-A18]|nr:cobalamin biosynthesis protein [Desulfovibrio sp. OttesenSCG-928-A18]
MKAFFHRHYGENSRLAVHVFTPQGMDLAMKTAGILPCVIFSPAHLARELSEAALAQGSGGAVFSSLGEHMRQCFERYAAHLFISACGIAVRAIAPVLRDKYKDPAVLVLDQSARHLVSLLGGHQSKANALARELAPLLGACPVVSTATDMALVPALDEIARDRGFVLDNAEKAKELSAALLAEESVQLDDPDCLLADLVQGWPQLLKPGKGQSPAPGERLLDSRQRALAVCVDWRTKALPETPPSTLFMRPPLLFVGIGCRKGADAQTLLHALRAVFSEHRFAPGSIAALASLDAKSHEQGLLDAAKALEVPFWCFSAAELAAYPVSKPSPKAMEVFSVPGVCESAAQAAAQNALFMLQQTSVTTGEPRPVPARLQRFFFFLQEQGRQAGAGSLLLLAKTTCSSVTIAVSLLRLPPPRQSTPAL